LLLLRAVGCRQLPLACCNPACIAIYTMYCWLAAYYADRLQPARVIKVATPALQLLAFAPHLIQRA
jgi:hypothetical protein